jgi:hypothetical protein
MAGHPLAWQVDMALEKFESSLYEVTSKGTASNVNGPAARGGSN